MIQNPWHILSKSAPFVLPADATAIAQFNLSARPDHAIHLEIVPEPFLGNPSAPVVLLNKNPGFVESGRQVHLESAFNAAAIANLEHRHPGYPFYLLDPGHPSPGQDWWRPKLRALIEAVGLRSVAANVFVAELHGYHSKSFSSRLHVPSQAYTRQLVVNALARGATFVVMRGMQEWQALVPELGRNPSLVEVVNPRNPAISPRNCPELFERILARVRRAG
jgi:hypothetical protein